jgi:hypothetical protein
MSLQVVLLMLLLQLSQSEVLQARKSSVEGLVLSAVTGEPIEDAVVILAKTASEIEISLTTDSRGRFVLPGLDAGTYRLVFESTGHVRQEYGQRAFPGKGTPITLAESQTLKNVVVHLTPTGSVSGRILGESKQPLAGIPIRLLRFGYDAQGKKTLRQSGAGRTNDRGEYRLYFITPGRYYLSAGTASSPSECWEFKAGPNEVREIYANAYYPGVADSKFASAIEVPPAAEINGIDLTLPKTQLFRVRGRITDSTTGQPPVSAERWLNGDYFSGCGLGFESSFQNGMFEFRDVPPGSYSVGARADVSRRAVNLPVVVANRDIDGIQLTLFSGVSIAGHVSIEGPHTLEEFTQRQYEAGVGLGELGYARLKADRMFQIDNVFPGEYRLFVWPDRSSAVYIKEARFGSVDVLSAPFHVAGPDSRTLEILLSSNFGAVDGAATGALGPVPGAQIVLVPDKSRHRHELFRAVTADQNGRFSIANVVPGDYKVFAWEAIEPSSWFDTEVLSRYESRGSLIRVRELSKQVIEVKTIASIGGSR